MSQPLRPPRTLGPDDPGDPAYFLLERGRNDPSKRTPVIIKKDGCYICEDPEFSMMGLPVCKPCPVLVDGLPCGQHWAADDCVCDAGCDVQEYYLSQRRS